MAGHNVRNFGKKQCKQYKMDQLFKPTGIFEDNASCVNQMNIELIKVDRVKHINFHIFDYA
jgi:hypothetical protein